VTSWDEVWGRRRLDASRPTLLAQLMAADGYDTGFGDLDEASWRAFVADVGARLEVAPETSIYEVGCGAGAFLLDLHDAGCTVGGLDASAALVDIARQALPRAELQHAPAAAVDPEPRYDVVVSCGAFLYFPSLAYARDVLARMVTKARRAVAVLDVPDLDRRDAALAMRRGRMDAASYEAKYRGLDHLFFERGWFTEALAGMRVEIHDQAIAGYANGAHRFNVFAWR
jgi:trans-aconitate methyltransferase